MKKNGILNPQLNKVISEMGHRDMLIIADAGLPVPQKISQKGKAISYLLFILHLTFYI